MTFTIIGYFDDTGQVFAQSVEANDPHHAMSLAPNMETLVIVCAIEGRCIPTPACEDSGKVAYAEDLVAG